MKNKIKRHRETFCMRIQPEILEEVQRVAEYKNMSVSSVVEKLILNSISIMDFKYIDAKIQLNSTVDELMNVER